MTTQRPLPDPMESTPFACDVAREGDAARLALSGTLDMATVPAVQSRIAELRAAGVTRLTVDLGALVFMDSSGLRLLLDADAAARRDGFSLTIVPGPPAVQRVFVVTGTLDHLPFADASA